MLSKPREKRTMRMNNLLIISASALALTLGTAQAAHLWEDPNAWAGSVFTYTATGPKYTAQELSLDAFGSYVARERGIEHLFETSIKHRRGWWGGGVGINYFITQELGISGEVNMPSDGGKLVDDILGSLILRLPLEPSGFAPYIFGGGGRQIQGWTTVVDPDTGDTVHPYGTHWEWEGHAGVGLEYRLNPATGIFIDGRYLWTRHTDDKLLLRAGFRLVF